MKNRAMLKSSLREIVQTKTRFLSILGIIFLGVAFFVGIGATGPDMLQTADNYYQKYHLADGQIISTLGLTEDDLELVKEDDTIAAVQGIKFADINLQEKNEITRIFGYQKNHEVNQYKVMKGRLPQKSGEIALDNKEFLRGKYKLGDTYTISKDDDPDGALKVYKFKIVGFVNNPSYVENVSRGNTSVGTGSLDYFSVVPEEDLDSEIYSQIVVRYKNLTGYEAYSDAYNKQLKKNQKHLENLLQERPEERLKEIKDDAQEEIDKGKKEIADGEQALKDADQKLADGKKQLDDGKQQLADAQSQLDSQIAVAQAEITANENQLSSSQKELEAKSQELASQKQALLAKASDIDTAKAGLKTMAEKKTEANASLQQVQDGINGATTASNYFSQKLNLPDDQFDAAAPELAAAAQSMAGQFPDEIAAGLNAFAAVPTKANLQVAVSGLSTLISQLQAQAATINDGIAQIDTQTAAIQSQVQAYENGLAQITAGESQIAAAQQQIDAGWSELNTGKAQLAQSQADGQAQIDASKSKLDDSEKDYEKGVAEYQKELAEQQPKLADAKKEIADQEQKLQDLKAEDYIFQTREDNPGFSEYKDNANRISSLATVFPLIFFLIAALVSLTTMTRMVEEKRSEIGTFKALGYKNRTISMKFLLYAATAGLLGAILGQALGYFLFPTIIITAYGQLYNIGDFVTPWYWNYSLIGMGVAFLCTVGTAFVTLRIDLLSTPAILMRPKAPKSGQRILLERVKPIWSRLNFIQKVTMRNLFRYKQRMLMTILGIAGCMAMIITGFGIRDSISDIVPTQYDKIWHYRGMVTFESGTNEDSFKDYFEQLEEQPKYKSNMMISSNSLELSKSGKSTQTVTVYAPKEPDKISDFILFNDRKSGEKYELTNDGAIINEKLAKLFDLKAGGTMTLKDSDGKKFNIKIAAIAENYTGHFAYMTPKYYEKIFSDTPEYNSDFVLFDEEPSTKQENQIAADLMENSQVINVTFLSQTKNALDDTIGILNLVVWVLIISAGLLAFIVLYNLTNINVSERIRELSTIKVLGFYDQEVTMYVYRENIILTLLGILLGVFLGKIEHAYVLQTVEVDLIMFSPNVHVLSYVYSGLITILFTLIVGVIMNFKLKKVDMIEALKSNE